MLKPKIMNKCECGGLFEDDELNHRTVHDVFATGDYWNTEVEVSCPKCGSDYIEEVTMCISCLEVEAEEGYDDCAKCRAEALEEEIVEYVQKNARYIDGLDGYTIRWNGLMISCNSPRGLVESIIRQEQNDGNV